MTHDYQRPHHEHRKLHFSLYVPRILIGSIEWESEWVTELLSVSFIHKTGHNICGLAALPKHADGITALLVQTRPLSSMSHPLAVDQGTLKAIWSLLEVPGNCTGNFLLHHQHAPATADNNCG